MKEITNMEAGRFEVIQTHASRVLLSPTHAYKLKKPKNFGFFDYSTPTLRRHFCIEEVRVNRRLAPHIYLGVAPVLSFPDGHSSFGPTFQPEDVPAPCSALNGGKVIDYAVVMIRLPDEATLEARVCAGTATPAMLTSVARHIAAFHASTHTDEHIASFGSLEVVRGNWEENFEQMKPYIGRTIDTDTYNLIAGYIRRFMHDRAALFGSRINEGRVRDCHGDLRLQHVYILDEYRTGEQSELPQMAILDGIEFNERFRYSDVACEIAFLTMELDALDRPDLSRVFVESYIAETGDHALLELLPFYSCYRACVRGKVLGFQLDELEVPEEQRKLAGEQAADFFKLAASYLGGSTSPTLMLVGGLMGTGKTTLALTLRRQLGWTLYASDTVRKSLAHIDPAQPMAEAFEQGLYSKEWTARTYNALIDKASSTLASGHSVLLDASFVRRADRQAAARLAQTAVPNGVNVILLECTCPRELALQRLAQRWKSRIIHEHFLASPLSEASRASGVAGMAFKQHTCQAGALLASDGRPDLYDAQCAAWQAFDPAQEAGVTHIVIDTAHPLSVNIEQVLETLHVPRRACWL